MVGGEGTGPEIRPVFLQTGSQRLQKKLQWSTPTARVLPVCWPSLPGIYQHCTWKLFSFTLNWNLLQLQIQRKQMNRIILCVVCFCASCVSVLSSTRTCCRSKQFSSEQFSAACWLDSKTKLQHLCRTWTHYWTPLTTRSDTHICDHRSC